MTRYQDEQLARKHGAAVTSGNHDPHQCSVCLRQAADTARTTRKNQMTSLKDLQRGITTAEHFKWVVSPDAIDALDIADPDRVDGLETIDVGPLNGEYVRLAAFDLVLVADALHRLADRIIDVTVDSREEFAAQECPYCRTIIDPGDQTCGSESCCREYELDLMAESRESLR